IGAGYLYYAGTRSNGFTALESFLFSFTGSLLWEYLAEFREKVSINDVLVTPVGGAIMGEVMYRLSEFLWSIKDSFLHKTFATLSDPVGAINRWINGSYPKRSTNLDQYGLSKDIFHQMRFAVGASPKAGLVN